jgi:multimeric flavodoxin WrbA
MKAIAINGSARPDGNTALAIRQVEGVLAEKGIVTETIHIGSCKFAGCRACGACRTLGQCVIDDGLNEITEKAVAADALIVASPVYFAGMNGELKIFLDRMFYGIGQRLRFKPCAALAVARRAGVLPTFDAINKYFQIAEMLIAPTIYWTGVFGATPGETAQDTEGAAMLEQVARNLTWLAEVRRDSGIALPERVKKPGYNYIR